MKKTVYLDSTIPSYYWDNRSSIQGFIEITRKWWDYERTSYELYISDYTLVEISRGEYPNKEKIIDFVSDISLIESQKELEEIAQVYINEFVMPGDAAGDAFHLACASFYKIDYLLTWNCNNLANANKKQHIIVVNTKLGLYTPQIITPLELFSERK